MQLDLSHVRSQFPAFSVPGLADRAFFENAGGSYACAPVIDRLGAGDACLGDRGQERVDAHGLAFLGDDLGQLAGDRRGDLDGHLVGLQFAQQLVGRHGVARLLEPGGDGRFRDAFAEGGHTDFDGHWVSSP